MTATNVVQQISVVLVPTCSVYPKQTEAIDLKQCLTTMANSHPPPSLTTSTHRITVMYHYTPTAQQQKIHFRWDLSWLGYTTPKTKNIDQQCTLFLLLSWPQCPTFPLSGKWGDFVDYRKFIQKMYNFWLSIFFKSLNLKGQSNEIFDPQFFLSFEPAWATD